MINIKDFRKNTEKYLLSTKLRWIDIDFDKFEILDKEINKLKKNIEKLYFKKNDISKNKKIKPNKKEIMEIKIIMDKIENLKLILNSKLKLFQEIQSKIPNYIDNELLKYKNNDEDIILRDYIDTNIFDWKISHIEILENRMMIEKINNKIIFKDWFIRLKHIIVHRIFEKFENKWIRSIMTLKWDDCENKLLVNNDIDINDEIYEILQIYQNKTIDWTNLPERYIFIKPWNKFKLLDNFNCESIIFISLLSPDDTYKETKLILSIIEEIYNELWIKYCKELSCIKNLKKYSSITFKIKSHFINHKHYFETSECSNYNDYISRKFNIKYTEWNNKDFLWFVMWKINIIALILLIIENNQTNDLRINIPLVLSKYFNWNQL